MNRLIAILFVAALALGWHLAPSAALAQDAAPPQTLITNVSVWDGTSDALAIGQSVLVEGNLIKQVGPNISAPSGATVRGTNSVRTRGNDSSPKSKTPPQRCESSLFEVYTVWIGNIACRIPVAAMPAKHAHTAIPVP